MSVDLTGRTLANRTRVVEGGVYVIDVQCGLGANVALGLEWQKLV